MSSYALTVDADLVIATMSFFIDFRLLTSGSAYVYKKVNDADVVGIFRKEDGAA